MANSLISAGYEVSVIHEETEETTNFNSDVKLISIYTGIKNSGIKRYFLWHRGLSYLLKSLEANIAIASDLYSLPAVALQSKNIRKIFDSRELYSQHGGLKNKPFIQFFWSTIERYFIKKIDLTFVTAPGDKEYLVNRFGKINIEIIYNFPSDSLIPNKHNQLRDKLGLSSDTKIFLYQGVIHNHRGIRKLIDLLDYFPTAVVVIIGSGSALNDIQNYTNEKKMMERVFFTGNIPYSELLNYTQCADIGFAIIQPITKSYNQALPNKIFEYSLCGVPVIASNLPEMKKFVQQYNLGELVNPKDKDDHVQAVNTIFSKNRNYAGKKNELTWEFQSNKFLKLVGADA